MFCVTILVNGGIIMIKYAIIGSSRITDSFIKGTELIDGLELVGVYSRSIDRAIKYGKQFGASLFFDSLEDLAKCDQIDAVYIASPNSCHYEQSKLMLSHGKHVICEKPITVTAEQFRDNRKLAKEKGLIYIDAIISMHQPQLQLVLNNIQKLGRICGARFDFSRISAKYNECMSGELVNIFNPKMATGTLMDLGIYTVYPAIKFFGKPLEILSSAAFMHTGADCSGSSILKYADKTITLTYAKTGTSYMGSDIYGDLGTLHFDSISQMTSISFIDLEGNTTEIYGVDEKHILMSREAADFVKYITEPKKYHNEYEEISDLTESVLEVLDEIRLKSNINFD